jgi:hypothetical protein
LAALFLALLAAGPVSAAAASLSNRILAQAASAPAIPAASLTGSVTDNQGASLVGASVSVVGPASYQTTTDAKGNFSLPGIKPGVYDITIAKPGYTATNEQGYVVVPGSSQQIAVTLAVQTFSSLREIGSVTSRRGGTFNTTAAAVANVSAQTFVNNANPGVAKTLDQLPGLTVEHPGGTADASSPGGVTFPSIRGSLGFETASLVDGHPLANGAFGDFVTTFLNAYAFQGAELVKGPGASSPVVNYAIGGTINFRTKDPTSKPFGNVTIGTDGTGGSFDNLLYSGTTTNGKLGWALDYASYGTPGDLHNVANPWDLSSGVSINGGKGIGFTTNQSPNAAANGVQNNPFVYSSTLLACCFHVNTTYVEHSELAKLRYKFSGVTSAMVSYFGTQAFSDQNGNHVYGISQLFNPCASSGAVAPCPAYGGSPYAAGGTYTTWQKVFAPENEWETDNEPMFQAELHTSIKDDSLLFRYYGAAISRLQFNGLDSPLQSYTTNYALYGTDGAAAGSPGSAGNPFNGQVLPVTFGAGSNYCLKSVALPLNWVTNPYVSIGAGKTCSNGTPALAGGGTYFRSAEEDHLQGLTFRYDHPLSQNGSLLTVSYDSNAFRSHNYSFLNDPTGPPSIPDGSRARFGTLLLRGAFNIGPRWQATLSNYFNNYYQRYSIDGGSTFKEFNTSHYDARLAATYRSNSNISYRFAVGSAIAPPYLGLLNTTPSLPGPLKGGATFYTNKITNGTIVPETSFGYDFGADYRFGRDLTQTFSWDAYNTTLWNQFVQGAIYQVCVTYNQPTQTCVNPTQVIPGAGNAPLYTTSNFNLSNARYAGLELSYKMDPAVGWGGNIDGELQRGYPYNLPPCFYSNQPATNCSLVNTNLGIISGANFYPSGESGSPGSYNVIQSAGSHAIPYAQGYAEVHYRWRNSMYASFGAQYYGNNNSLNVPAFIATNATFRLPVSPDQSTTLQLTANNIGNAYPNTYITWGAGVPVPLANGKTGLTNQNSLGPRTFLLTLSKNFDWGKPKP